MGKIGGVDRVQIDDLVLKVGDTVTITKNKKTRESVTGLTGDAGYKETHRPARVEFEMLVDGAIKVGALEDKTNSTVSVVTSAKTYVLRNARQVGDLELAGADGKVTVAFEGPICVEF